LSHINGEFGAKATLQSPEGVLPMEKLPSACLTERHLLLFGTIVQWFAHYEVLMQDIAANLTGSDPGAVMLLTRGVDFNGKRHALLDLLRHRTVPLDQFDRVNSYLMVPATFLPLRNDIVHSAWMQSTQSSSWIQPDWILRLPPGVKPVHFDATASGDAFVELDQDKVAFSLEDLSKTVSTLAENYEAFVSYLKTVGLLAKPVGA
jgi:hypothetical protein